jgi:hypothetical protein
MVRAGAGLGAAQKWTGSATLSDNQQNFSVVGNVPGPACGRSVSLVTIAGSSQHIASYTKI